MKNTKTVNKVIDKFFERFNELPHEVSKIKTNLYKCISANVSANIEIKNTECFVEFINYNNR